MTEREVVFIDGVRTPFGRLGGVLKDFFASQLASFALKGLLDKTKVAEKAHVDSVFAGSALHCSRAPNPARWMGANTISPSARSTSAMPAPT